jgi:hypothetical protein
MIRVIDHFAWMGACDKHDKPYAFAIKFDGRAVLCPKCGKGIRVGDSRIVVTGKEEFEFRYPKWYTREAA